ncbi:MAG: hypothetical protein ACR2HR_14560 [Euzebya sp.]
MSQPKWPGWSALTAALSLVVLASACTGSQPALLLLAPQAPGGTDPTTAEILEQVPGGLGECGQHQADQWREPPRLSPVISIPEGFTASLTGPSQRTGDESVPLTVVCDFDPQGRLLVADELRTTGTDQSVGNDYITRTGAIHGRVDVGVPDDAVTAVQTVAGRTVIVPLPQSLRTVRFHAISGGNDQSGYDIGQIRFLDAQGEDVTAASVPIPDVVHGVPRSRGSGVED